LFCFPPPPPIFLSGTAGPGTSSSSGAPGRASSTFDSNDGDGTLLIFPAGLPFFFRPKSSRGPPESFISNIALVPWVPFRCFYSTAVLRLQTVLFYGLCRTTPYFTCAALCESIFLSSTGFWQPVTLAPASFPPVQGWCCVRKGFLGGGA